MNRPWKTCVECGKRVRTIGFPARCYDCQVEHVKGLTVIEVFCPPSPRRGRRAVTELRGGTR